MRILAVNSVKKLLSVNFLILLLVESTIAPVAAATPVSKHINAPVAAPTHTSVRKGAKGVTLFKPETKFSDAPTDAEIENARVFLQRILPADNASVNGENKALAKAITAYKAQTDTDDFTEFKTFVTQFPTSRWTPSIKANLGEKLFAQGYLTEALSDWRSAWEATKDSKNKTTIEVADQAVTNLMILEARLGLTNQMAKDVDACKNRKMYGSNEKRIVQAEESVAAQKTFPERSFHCGPHAVGNVLKTSHQLNSKNANVIKDAKSSTNGTNLAQLKALTDKANVKYQFARRTPGAPLIVPSVMHWRLGHFGAITAKNGSRYHLTDPTFDENGSAWLSQKAIDTESDGYFLVPEGALPTGWISISSDEASKVWGKGSVFWNQSGKSPSQPKKKPGPSCSIGGMATAEAFLFQGTLNIHDTPLRYQPPVGPAVEFLVNYNYLEGEQPASFQFTNLGQDWTINWVSYLTLDSSKNATVHVRGGGYETYNYVNPDNIQNPYVPDLTSQAQLFVPTVGTYQRQLTDGSVEVFNQPDGSGRIFMTEVIDPQGNSTSIQYDSTFRVTSIIDPILQQSTFTYLSNVVGNSGYYVLSQISDPFGRTANFVYDATNSFLLSSTDQMGLKSSFIYDTGSSFINLMTTPYGSTGFSTTYFQNSYVFQNGIRFDYPDGTSAVVANFSGTSNGSWYWDRETMRRYPNDYADPNLEPQYPETTLWAASGDDPSENYTSQPVAASLSNPIDYPITYTYAGQGVVPDGHYITPGPINKPITTVQGSKTYSNQFNAIGKMTQSVDPVGRTISYLYAANNIDLLEKRQTRGTNNDLLGKWIYSNKQHLPNKYIDGSGQMSTMTYNKFGQLLTRTDPTGAVWTNVYDTNGYLTEINGPLPGGLDKTTISYDGYGRVYQVTDSEGYTLTYSYDNADRLTATTYPDGTFEQNIYDKLDVVMSKDRIGRWTTNIFDSMDQMVATIDPLGRKTQYAYCACGAVSKLTDPLGQETFWSRDLEARVIQKTMNDQTSISYKRDQYGRVITKTDALGQSTNYNYNLDDTLASKTYTNAINPTSEVDYTWDPNYSRLASVANGWGTYNYSYVPYITDPFGTPITGGGKLQTVTNSVIANSTISYSYDSLGRVTNRSINGSTNSDNWSYDAISRITNETNSLGSFDFHYVDDTPGSSKGVTRLSSINYPNGQVTNYSWYGNLGDQRLQQINNLNPSSAILSQFNYQYDAAGEITQWGQQAGSNPALQYQLGYDLAGQLTSANATLGNSAAPTAANYNYGYDVASNRNEVQQSISQTIRLTGTVTAGDTVTITVNNSDLSAGSETYSYTVISGDTLATIATKIAAGITANSDFQTIGVNASSTSNLITVRSVNQNPTTYGLATNTGATETLAQGVVLNGTQNVALGGTATPTDVLNITISDAGLAGGQQVIAYTVPTGASLPSIASAISAAINANTSLQSIGVTANSYSSTVSITSTSSHATTYTQSVSSGATETLALSTNLNGVTTAVVNGIVTAGNTIALNIFNNAITGSGTTLGYTIVSGDTLSSIATNLASAINANASLQAIGVSASSSGAVLNIKSTSLNMTTYSSSTNSGATSALALSPSFGAVQSQFNNVNALIAQSSGGYLPMTGTTNKPITSVSAGTNNVRISAEPSVSIISGAVGTGQAQALEFGKMGGLQTLIVQGAFGYAQTATLTVKNPYLPSGQESVSYSNTTSTDIYHSFAASINSDANLQSIGFTATVGTITGGQEILYFHQLPINKVTYSASVSTGATEIVTLGTTNNGNVDVSIKGLATAGDTITLTANNPVNPAPVSVTYTVTSSDTLPSVATNLAAAINASSGMQNFLLSATNQNLGTLLSTQSFQVAPLLSNNQNLVAITAQDGGGNQKTNQFPASTHATTAHTLTYDLNGNMTSDGINTYQWDAENRLVQINYSGSGNSSKLTPNSFGQLVQIVESAGGITSSTKQFVWADNEMKEARDASSLLTSQYFRYGQTISGSSYFYTLDHLGSVRDMTKSSGVVEAQYGYGIFGELSQTAATLTSDFQYAGYYYHALSGLNLTTYRAYNPILGRWVNRDPDNEDDGTNLYAYVANDPINYLDPDGNIATASSIGSGPGSGSYGVGPPGGSNNNNGPSDGGNNSGGGGGGGDPCRTPRGNQKNRRNKEADKACGGKSGAALIACICAFLRAGYDGSSGTEREEWKEAEKAVGCRPSRGSRDKKKKKKTY